MSWLWAAGRTRSDKGHLRCCHFTEHGWGWRRQDRQGFIVPDRSGNVFCDQHGLHCQLAKCPKTYWNMWDHVSNEQSAEESSEQRQPCCQVQPSAWVCSLTAARSIFCSAHSFTKAKVNVQSTEQHDCNMAQPSEKKCCWAIGPLEHQASAGKLICVVLMRQSPMSQLSQWKQRLKMMMTLDDTSMYSMYRWLCCSLWLAKLCK